VSARCSSCKADVFWAMSAGGKPLPIDPEPREDGNLVVRRALGGGRVAVSAKGVPAGEQRYVSHFATCPYADQHRRKSHG
jgi:hypothetical protein